MRWNDGNSVHVVVGTVIIAMTMVPEIAVMINVVGMIIVRAIIMKI